MTNKIAEAATRTVDARERVRLCPPQSPAWRNLMVTAEEAWQGLVLVTGSAAAAQAVLSNRLSSPQLVAECNHESYAWLTENTGPYRRCVDCGTTEPWEGPDERD